LSSHVPVAAVSVLPTVALPDTVGTAEFVGGAVTRLDVHVDDTVEALPAASDAAPAATATVSVPPDGLADVTSNAYVVVDPVLLPFVHVLDVPPTVTSDVEAENPVTASLNVAVNANAFVDVYEPAAGDDERATVGPTVSMVMSSAGDALDTFPAESESVTVIDHVPSLRVPRVQLPAETVHVTGELPAFVAVTVPVPVSPVTVSVGVLSFVRSSVALDPESDAAARSGALAGVAGPAVSIVSGSDDDADEVVAPIVCVAVTVHEPSVISGNVQL
jgi:hypothetical protein